MNQEHQDPVGTFCSLGKKESDTDALGSALSPVL